MVGIRVARMFCRKRNMTRNTRITASTSVFTTSLMDILTTGVVSYGKTALIPGGKNLDSSATFAFTASAVLMAFAPVVILIASPAAGLPS